MLKIAQLNELHHKFFWLFIKLQTCFGLLIIYLFISRNAAAYSMLLQTTKVRYLGTFNRKLNKRKVERYFQYPAR